MTFLSGRGAAGAGGTVAWPGSHRRMQALYLSDPTRYEDGGALQPMMPGLCADIAPVEMHFSAGDVMFYHHLCGHASSGNASGEWRLAYNHKFSAPFQRQHHLLRGCPNVSGGFPDEN